MVSHGGDHLKHPVLANSLPQKERVLQSEDLFQGGREVIIEHCNTRYRLMITKAGKLILNK